MLPITQKENVPAKISYEAPSITLLNTQNTDIITESHFDSNMGEWDSN